MDKTICPKCNGKMSKGSVGGHAASGWFEDDINKNPLFKKAEKKDIHAYACQSCGYTELYTSLT